jgi:hypothetical protein
MRIDRRNHWPVLAMARTVVPGRARQAQRTIRTPGAQAMPGLHRQTQRKPLGLAQSFRESTSFRA